MLCRICTVIDGNNVLKSGITRLQEMSSDDFTAHSMRLCFDAKLKVMSAKGTFPNDTIAAVFVTNRDDCSYQEANVAKDGTLSVDLNMRALKEGVRLTDRIKFHFFFRDNVDKLLKPICAGHIGLESLINQVSTGRGPGARIQCNFNTNTVEMNFIHNEEQGSQMKADLLRLSNMGALSVSVLGSDTKGIVEKLRCIDESVKEGLNKHLFVTSDNGGTMFQSLFTAHTMENEATLYPLYHHDFNNPENVPPWVCTYLLAESLHHNAVTPEQVKTMSPEMITKFIASYAQAPMRSATATPYTDDLIMNEDPQFFRSRNCTMLSEVFKRPFSHPYHVLQGHGCLIDDDCEGLAAMMRDMVNHLGLIFREHGEELRPIIDARGRGCSSSSLGGNNLMQAYFPNDLFSEMPVSYQARLIDMAVHLGEYIESKKIECHITLASAMGASFGSENVHKEIQAHACASLVCNMPNHAAAVMLEGTACMVDDHLFAAGKKIKLAGQYVTLVNVANSLTRNIAIGNTVKEGLKVKMAMHITHDKGSFYRTAFCQNGSMLASQIGSAPMQFGVDMEYLSDNGVKIHLPVTGMALPDGEYAKLEEYVKARSAEIHLPLVDHNLIRSKLNWAPMIPFNGCDKLQPGRPFMTLMVHVTSGECVSTKELLSRAQDEADEFNKQPEHSKHLGMMRAVATMDGVSKLFHLYTDDLSYLQKSIVLDSSSSSETRTTTATTTTTEEGKKLLG